jgi:DNA-binding IclR family transcriptional regulator
VTTIITDAEVEVACNAYDGQCFRMASPTAMRAALAAVAQVRERGYVVAMRAALAAAVAQVRERGYVVEGDGSGPSWAE